MSGLSKGLCNFIANAVILKSEKCETGNTKASQVMAFPSVGLSVQILTITILTIMFATITASCSGGSHSPTGTSLTSSHRFSDTTDNSPIGDATSTAVESESNETDGVSDVTVEPFDGDRTLRVSNSHPDIRELDRSLGKTRLTDCGLFTLFIVDSNNNPIEEYADKCGIAFDTEACNLTVNADFDKAPLDLYMVLYYDDSLLAPVSVENLGYLGDSSEALSVSITQTAGFIAFATARIGDTSADKNGSGDVLKVGFNKSPFVPSRALSSVEDMRKAKAPTDFRAENFPDGSFILNWTERNVGDYDGNGEVGVPDITPIAQNYLTSVNDATNVLERELYEQIDGDRTGEIGVSDITPIAQNYLNRLEGYDVWSAESSENYTWLPNLENTGLNNSDTASAPRPDTEPPAERAGLALQYTYDTTSGAKGAKRGTPRDPSALFNVYFAAYPHEDGLDTTPPDVVITSDFSETTPGSNEYMLDVSVTGVYGPFTLAVTWEDGTRPEIFDNFAGDGTDSGFIHLYSAAGSYYPSFVLISPDGYMFAKTLREVNVDGPTAFLTSDVDEGSAPLTVGFNASNSVAGGSPIALYEWDWDGDGLYDDATGTTSTNEHVYTVAGVYNATVKITDEADAFDTASLTITVNGAAVAQIDADPTSGLAPLSVNFNASGSYSANGDILVYEWDLDGDGTFEQNTGYTPTTQHIYMESGDFDAAVRVTDEISEQAVATTTVSVLNNPPVAAIEADITIGKAPQPVNFNANGSTDSDGSIIRYEWDFENDGTFELNTGNVPTAQHIFPSIGTYTAVVKVTDDADGSDTAQIVIDIATNNIPPVPVPTVVNDKVYRVTELAEFGGAGSNDPDGTIVLYEWDFQGDGVYDAMSSESGTASYYYEADEFGDYNARLRVTDDNGVAATASVKINVMNNAPDVYVTSDVTEGTKPLTVNFFDDGCDDPDGTIVEYQWDFGYDGTPDYISDTSPDTQWIFNDPGDVYCVLTAIDNDGAQGTFPMYIYVNEPPVADIVASPDNGTAPVTITLDAGGSTDSDGTIEKYEWDFDGDGTWDEDTGNTPIVDHEYTNGGYFYAVLRVTDDKGGTDTDSVLVKITGWIIEVAASDADSGQYCSLALDSGDNAHVSYHYINASQKYMKYSYRDNLFAEWHELFTDDTGDLGSYTSIAVDSNDNPHISYREFTENKWGLCYAGFDGTSWTKAFPHTGIDFAYSTSIAVDSTDNPHISYFDNSLCDLWYASFDGTDWETTKVDETGNIGMNCQLRLDSSGNPAIVYVDRTSSSAYKLKYAKFNPTPSPGAWEIETLNDANLVTNRWHCSLALDSADRPYIAYPRHTPDGLGLTYKEGALWFLMMIDAGTTATYPSIEIDSNDKIHVSYVDVAGVNLKYSYYNGTTWTNSFVDESPYVGLYSSLEVDSADLPHIAYFDDTNNELKYAYYFIPL